MGLLSDWYSADTIKTPAISLIETVKLKVPVVRPKPDEIVFGTPAHNESVNLWLVIMFSIMFFVFFVALLWMFS